LRISDVLASDVFDAGGRRLGRVRDVRLVLDGPQRGALAGLRVDAVIVGGSGFAGRLGYLRGGVRGPAPLAGILRRLEDNAMTVAATDIVSWDLEARRLVLAAGATERFGHGAGGGT
jgi:hypothetical protein